MNHNLNDETIKDFEKIVACFLDVRNSIDKKHAKYISFFDAGSSLYQVLTIFYKKYGVNRKFSIELKNIIDEISNSTLIQSKTDEETFNQLKDLHQQNQDNLEALDKYKELFCDLLDYYIDKIVSDYLYTLNNYIIQTYIYFTNAIIPEDSPFFLEESKSLVIKSSNAIKLITFLLDDNMTIPKEYLSKLKMTLKQLNLTIYNMKETPINFCADIKLLRICSANLKEAISNKKILFLFS